MANEAIGFFERHWGDVASVAGFIYAIITLLRTKKAVEQSKMVAIQIREQLARVNSVGELAAVLEIIEEIVRLHLIKAWEVSLERYPAVRRRLVSIQESPSKVTVEQKAILARSVEQFRLMQQTVERARSRNAQEGLDWARLNKNHQRSWMT